MKHLKKFLLTGLLCVTAGLTAGVFTACDEEPSDSGNTPGWTMETVYAQAQELGYKGTLEEFRAELKGTNGKDGVGIADVTVSADGKMTVTLSQGEPKIFDFSALLNCDHDYGGWTTGLSATCTSIGYDTRVCSNCGDVDYRFIAATGHDYGEAVCIGAIGDQDVMAKTCDGCGDVHTEYLAHSYEKGNCIYCKAPQTQGLSYTLNDERTAYSVGIGDCMDTEAYIPSKYNGLPVTGVAFYNATQVTSVTIYDSVTRVAFNGCTSLTSIEVSSENTAYKSIDGNVYTKDGTELVRYAQGKTATSFTIPNSVTSIGDRAFSGCEGLTGITIPNSVTSIGNSAFSGCMGLKGVYITDMTAWCNIVFADGFYISRPYEDISNFATANPLFYARDLYLNGNLVTELTIPDDVTSVGVRAFYGCRSLTSVTIPNSVTSIGAYAFYGCCSLVEIYNKSSLAITAGGVDNGYVGYYAKAIYTEPYTSKVSTDANGYVLYTDGADVILLGYTGTETALTLPSTVTAINNYAFYNCTNLTSITIPNSVTSIGNGAFELCTGLTSITIPDSVTHIGAYAFLNCHNDLSEVTFENTSGWQVSTDTEPTSISIDVTDKSQAATYLTWQYSNYYWNRSE